MLFSLWVTMYKSIEVINNIKTKVGESARWSPKTQCYYWIDVQQPYLYCYNPKIKISQSYLLPTPLNCIDFNNNDELIGIMSNSLVKILIKNNKAEVDYIKTTLIDDDSVAFNDGLFDLKGNLWVGTMDKSFKHNSGKLYRISPSGEIMAMDEG